MPTELGAHARTDAPTHLPTRTSSPVSADTFTPATLTHPPPPTPQDIFSAHTFELEYDYLVVATGCKTNTFGTPGVAEREGKEV